MNENTPYFFVRIGKIEVEKLKNEKNYLCFNGKTRPDLIEGSFIKKYPNSISLLLSSDEMREMGIEVPKKVISDEKIVKAFKEYGCRFFDHSATSIELNNLLCKTVNKLINQ